MCGMWCASATPIVGRCVVCVTTPRGLWYGPCTLHSPYPYCLLSLQPSPVAHGTMQYTIQSRSLSLYSNPRTRPRTTYTINQSIRVLQSHATQSQREATSRHRLKGQHCVTIHNLVSTAIATHPPHPVAVTHTSV